MRSRALQISILAILALAVVLLAIMTFGGYTGVSDMFTQIFKSREVIPPETVFQQYTACIADGRYEDMYAMLDEQSQLSIAKDDFIARNGNIYEGIGACDIVCTPGEFSKDDSLLEYSLSMDTSAGQITFTNSISFVFEKEEGVWRIVWNDGLLFPGLEPTDKVRISTQKAKRGNIFDRNGTLLAGEGTVTSVGLVPGKMSEDAAADLQSLAALLDLTVESIEKNLSASWVKDDLFVPIRKLKKIYQPDTGTWEIADTELEEALLKIPGVKISNETSRVYPLGEKAAHLVGYVQAITAEELQGSKADGYTSQSLIGKVGLEALYEERLRARDGIRIYIMDQYGKEKEVLADKPAQDGKDIVCTIDAKVQSALYEQFCEDKSCSVAMDPWTGEVLALVSTPAYDNNDFVVGFTQNAWEALLADETLPMYNRFRKTWVPGSSFKPVTAAIGLTAGAFTQTDNFGYSGLQWQKDKSWGNYYVTTLHTYGEDVSLENALVYSDNIYFAKAALKIGAEAFTLQLQKIGFRQTPPFDIVMTPSQFANKESIETEIQLADSGYGQGEILVNPLHLAAIYSAFVNEGNMIRPYLLYSENVTPTFWVEGAFSSKAASVVSDALLDAVSSPNGTGHAAYMEGLHLAGKTGTAEIKATKDDTTGTELGWFVVFPTERDTAAGSVMIVSMVEDVKDRGGSGYVVKKVRGVLDVLLPLQR
jgi:cell division protein FtsI/penicillin-binding protein 2